ncbi:ABC transporter ATP-binding protein [Modestobacter marinus]|uniref:ABC transporter ATP-binding protein n=1 Tax=Modestobacter marinus TaxID=477641 RepID=A0A846LDB1_9ACTN|nr:ATP-binding cassette domain-containing protein [Modestobacter marinus]NIH65647.1 ABC-2 type transport system ATP-binding protein [Modestobacter marinus]GGL66052.1 ABC transporter ATP-binding protein [Modestobacter marinus]
MIEVRGLTKQYGPVTAVAGLTFDVPPGVVTAFLGSNGAGKSTTLRMLLGLDRPTAGTARIDGSPYAELREPLRTVGSLLDSSEPHPGRTARAHLRWLAASNRVPARRIDEVLDVVDLTAVADRRVRGFSLGMRRRLGLAAALLGDPSVLLLDEPVNGLDAEGIRWLRTSLRQLAAEGRTVVVSSHLMSEVEQTADHLLVLSRGRLLADTSLPDLLAGHSATRVLVRTPQARRLAELLTAGGATVAVQPDGALHVAGVGADVVSSVAARHAVPLLALGAGHRSLEDAFLALTTGADE